MRTLIRTTILSTVFPQLTKPGSLPYSQRASICCLRERANANPIVLNNNISRQLSRTFFRSNSFNGVTVAGSTHFRKPCAFMSTLPIMSNVRVLVDMDGVLADFEKHFLAKFREQYPDEPYIEVKDRRGFYVTEQYEKIKPDLKAKCLEIMEAPGFFLNLPPIPGGLEAVRAMDQMDGVDVFFCTASINKYKYCVTEKFQWIDNHFGAEFINKLVLTRDKTVVSGDLIIDDKPEITGAEKNPAWEHILFSTPQNSDIHKPNQRRLSGWKDPDEWKQIIDSKRQEKEMRMSAKQ
ncbi:5'(3')-deoxyribonucleotidase, cytosolic type-like [Ptychodera flava]|uniref:5'(3')-deoxyribonucleotidase, cytosolic type-like n=1 Tax=Ptychodera flava TaxID=63121 RepID=UPI003969F6D5